VFWLKERSTAKEIAGLAFILASLGLIVWRAL